MPGWGVRDIPDLAGKRAIVTGATDGIGFETAAALAGAKATVVLTGRNDTKGRAALDRIRARHPDARIAFAVADLANLASVAAFAAAQVGSGEPLDLLINNAGVMGLPRRTLTSDGFEMQFGTNHLGHFALTAQLVPALRRAGEPRVVTVASLAHRRARFDFDNLQGERRYEPFEAYGQAKLANLVFAQEFARRCRAAHSKIASVAAHPGFSNTHLFTNTLRARLAKLILPFVGQSAAAGALPSLYAATAPTVTNGGYYGPNGVGEIRGRPAIAKIGRRAQSATTAERLWEVSERLVGLTFPPLG